MVHLDKKSRKSMSYLDEILEQKARKKKKKDKKNLDQDH